MSVEDKNKDLWNFNIEDENKYDNKWASSKGTIIEDTNKDVWFFGKVWTFLWDTAESIAWSAPVQFINKYNPLDDIVDTAIDYYKADMKNENEKL